MRAKINETFGNIFVDVQSGKRFARDLAGNPAGTTLLRKYVATGRKPTYLIYELDTNDSDLSSAEAAQEIAELREILGSDTYIILMTAHSIAYDNVAFNTIYPYSSKSMSFAICLYCIDGKFHFLRNLCVTHTLVTVNCNLIFFFISHCRILLIV